jgi:hypothetical protein
MSMKIIAERAPNYVIQQFVAFFNRTYCAYSAYNCAPTFCL